MPSFIFFKYIHILYTHSGNQRKVRFTVFLPGSTAETSECAVKQHPRDVVTHSLSHGAVGGGEVGEEVLLRGHECVLLGVVTCTNHVLPRRDVVWGI